MAHQIVGLTHQGLGRTEDDQFLPRVLPGERIEVREDGTARVLTPSSDRVSPPCRHYKTCGGCAMQHAHDAFVTEWKQSIVVKALAARGLTAPCHPAHTSLPHSRRRAKFAGKRTKSGAVVGFHGRASATVFAIPECQLLTPALTQVIPVLENLTPLCTSRKAEASFTVTDAQAGVDVLINTTQPLTSDLRITLAAFAHQNGFARLSWGDETVVTCTPPAQNFGPASVVPPPGAFLQATQDGEAALLDGVKLATEGAKRCVDLFAGCGTFSLPLAVTASVHAVEGEAAMLTALDRGWREAKGLKQVTTETRDLFRRPLLPDELARYDAAIIDPPRAGAETQIATLATSGIARIAMVSCNPVTFARDASTLVAAGYRLDWVRVVDQFRWSSHIEVVSAFTRL